MKKKMLAGLLAFAMVVGTITTAAPAVTANAAGDSVTAVKDGDTVTIGNEYISREFSIADGKLETTEIVNKRTDGGNTVFTPADGSEEFIVKLAKTGWPALDRTGWTAVADSYQNASGASDGPGQNLLDGNTGSIWHSNYGGGTGDQAYPYNVLIATGGNEVTFNCFSYTPRQGDATNGDVKGYELWAATSDTALTVDAEGWEKIAEGEFTYNGKNQIYVNLDAECTANQLKFVATSSNNGAAFGGGAEFNLHADAYAAPTGAEDYDFAASELELDGAPAITDTAATINNVAKTGKKVTFNFKPYTFRGVEFTISENIVMYEGDHFMRKYMEISIPDDKKDAMAIDYIDLESLKVNDTDATWTIPTDAGGVVQMERFKANLGQPIYIQGMFFGCEFPAADTEIVDGTGYMRYYTGKTFSRFEKDNQLTQDGKYVTWQTVAGAARSTENEVIQADFFEYIESIATPSEFRAQYNSWFDNMMLIDDANILESFIEVDRELNAVETRPLDSYVVDDGWNNYNKNSVVDADRSGTTLNETGFWEFNNKFPEKLTPSSELVQNFGSNFGVWIGPRGGYNFYGTLADILTASGKGSKAGGSIDVADREYVKNFQEMAIEWQDEYDVNYWKWDGFADQGQYNTFAATDGVPGYANRHMTGGYHHMYHVTDLWEAWIDLMEACRKNADENGINKLWISLTCYVHPSPWFLQWANSVWIQCVYDQKDADFGLTKMNKQITYRDAMYYDFLANHEFQFPLANVYNHDPIYGKEGTGMNINTATDEDFKNYLYMLSTRGTAFWELYYSDSIMTPGKYEVTAEFLAWAEENYHMLRNAKMIGGKPDITLLSNGSSNENQAEAYGFSCFDGTDGLLSLRNPSTKEAKTITFTFDRTMGVAEGAGTLKYHLEHAYRLTDGTAATGTLEYGKEYSITLQPNEVRILRISKDGDTTAPAYTRAYTDGDKTITVKFDEKVNGSLFTVEGAGVASIDKSADGLTYHITLTKALADGAEVTITAKDIKDLAGNALTDKTISVVYNAGNVVVDTEVSAETTVAEAADAIASNNGFTVAATVENAASGVVVSQGESYELGINADGYAYFTLNGATAVSKTKASDGATIVGAKENNGILKLYVNGTLEGSAYKAANRYYDVEAAAITAGGDAFGKTAVSVYDTALGYDAVAAMNGEEETKTPLATSGMTVSVPGTSEGDANNIFDGDPTTFWTSAEDADGIAKADPYLTIDLGDIYVIDQFDYTKRYYDGPQNQWKCTGNLRAYVLEVSTDGQEWQEVSTGSTFDDEAYTTKADGGTTEITFNPVEAKYVRISGTASYHWQAENVNKYMTVADVKIYGEAKEATNIAKDKKVTAAWTADGSSAEKGGGNAMSIAVDGTNNNTGSYAEFGLDNNTNSSYMQVDLGKVSEIESINLYRYWNDGRTYRDTVVAIANTEADFANGNATIVYNADASNAHGLGAGEDAAYAETSAGKTFTLDSAAEGRFVRVYMRGQSDSKTTNHVVEIEVMGYQSADEEVVGADITTVIDRLAELSAIDTEDCSASSVAAFNALLAEAYALVESGAATEAEVNAVLARLENAEDLLESCAHANTIVTGKVDATCTEAGATGKEVCDDCGETVKESEVVPATGHTEETVAGKEATCTETGLTEGKKCSVCDTVTKAQETIPATGHKFGEWTVVKAPTIEAEGLEERVCACGEKEQRAIAKLPTVPEVVDKTALEEYIEACEEYYEEADYTAESWAVYAAALADAKEVLADEDVTKADVAAAVAALEAAAEALEEVSAEPEQPVDPEKPGTDDKEEDKEEDKSPVTGDTAMVLPMAVFMAACAAIVAAVLRKRFAR